MLRSMERGYLLVKSTTDAFRPKASLKLYICAIMFVRLPIRIFLDVMYCPEPQIF